MQLHLACFRYLPSQLIKMMHTFRSVGLQQHFVLPSASQKQEHFNSKQYGKFGINMSKQTRVILGKIDGQQTSLRQLPNSVICHQDRLELAYYDFYGGCFQGKKKKNYRFYLFSSEIGDFINQAKRNEIYNYQTEGSMLDSSGRAFILLYYNIRGKAQVIRNLLCYLEADFVELHLELVEAGIEKPEQEVAERLRERPIDRSLLPLLVDGNHYIYGTLVINLHLCKSSQKLQLLGKGTHHTVPEEAIQRQVHSILQKLVQSQMKMKQFMLEFAEKCSSKTDKQVKQLIHLTYENVMNNSHFIKEILEELEGQGKGRFIFGSLTIVDFYFQQCCFYLLGFFGNIDKDYNRSFQCFYNAVVSSDLGRKSNKMYLAQMRSFVTKMTALPFYHKNKDYLESYSLIFHEMSNDRREGLKKIWVGKPKYVK